MFVQNLTIPNWRILICLKENNHFQLQRFASYSLFDLSLRHKHPKLSFQNCGLCRTSNMHHFVFAHHSNQFHKLKQFSLSLSLANLNYNLKYLLWLRIHVCCQHHHKFWICSFPQSLLHMHRQHNCKSHSSLSKLYKHWLLCQLSLRSWLLWLKVRHLHTKCFLCFCSQIYTKKNWESLCFQASNSQVYNSQVVLIQTNHQIKLMSLQFRDFHFGRKLKIR